VLTLWQTNLLRRTKLTVLDEVANGLSFYDYTFLHEVPQVHCELEDRLNEGAGDGHGELASFLRMGSWIGGDRDGNPFVTAEVMRGTLRLQSSRVLRFYLEELHALGAELSLAAHLADVSDELRALAGRSPDTSPHRSGEPYRLAVSGIYARLTATALGLDVGITRPPVGEAARYASVKEFKTDLDILDRSLISNNSGVIARGRLRLLRRAVDCFGFHLASLVWGLSRSFGRATHLFSFLSFFVRSQSRFFVPIRALLGPARGEAVKVGRRTDLSAYSILARPYLDSFEHDGTLGAIGMTIGGEPACGTRIIAPQPCIR